MPLITPIRESENATPELVTKGLYDSTESREDKFQGTWEVYNVHFGPIRRKTMNSATGEEKINNEQLLSSLNPEAAEYQPQECVFYDPVEEPVRALDDHSSSDSFIPRRSLRIQERLINNRPKGQDISNVDRCTKVHASVHSDIKSDDDRRISTSTLPPKVNTDNAASGHRRFGAIETEQRWSRWKPQRRNGTCHSNSYRRERTTIGE